MNKKIIFFDIDGTLVVHQNGKEIILPSTIEAIQKTKEKGNLVYLCTGRSKAEIFDFILDVGFDGIIGAGGGFVEINNNVLYHKVINKSSVKHMVDFFEKNNMDYYLETNEGLFGSKNLLPRLERLLFGDIDSDIEARKRRDNKESPFINAIHFCNEMIITDINKACFLEEPTIPFDTIKQQFEDEFTIHHCTVPMFGHNSGELSIPGVDKATAIDAVIKHLGIKQEDTYAFGDGLNDIEMFEYCNCGIAMKDGKQGLKEIADEITLNSYEDAIYHSMKKHNLI